MKFTLTTLHVKEMDESLRFYREILDFEISRRMRLPSGTEIVFLDSGETQIELICDGSEKMPSIGKDISWGFTTESMENKLSVLRGKGYPVEGPIQPNPYIRFYYTRDPNGMRIQLLESVTVSE